MMCTASVRAEQSLHLGIITLDCKTSGKGHQPRTKATDDPEATVGISDIESAVKNVGMHLWPLQSVKK